MEIELKGLALPLWKLNPKHSISVQPSLKLTRIFFLVLPFLFFLQMPSHSPLPSPKNPWTNQTHSPYFYLRIAWSFRRLGLVRSAPGLLGFCIVAAARHVRSLRFASPEAFVAWVAGFLHRRGGETRPISAFCIAWSFRRLGLVRIGTWVSLLLLSSSFWTLWVAGFISPSLHY